jgi:hypothetical protein
MRNAGPGASLSPSEKITNEPIGPHSSEDRLQTMSILPHQGADRRSSLSWNIRPIVRFAVFSVVVSLC